MSFPRIAALVLLGSGWLVAASLWLQREQPAPPTAEIRDEVIQDEVEAPGEPELPPLTQLIGEWSARPGFEGATLGVCVLNAEGKLRAGFNETLALVPASSLKTVTTATALEVLGPEFTFETVLAAPGEISAEGTITGDLVLIGSGIRPWPLTI
jgi:D-alanyl-D-alanine carboxypeptidase